MEKFKSYALNISIIFVACAAIYLTYTFIKHTVLSVSRENIIQTDTSSTKITRQPVDKILQVDIQNGTKVTGIAENLMDFLRDNRIDAVEIGNFSNQEVENSFVIDRAGNLKNAKFIAQVLDIPERRVIQQMNKNYFLDATIVLGKDYKNLTPYRKK